MTQERLKELLDYDPETGLFWWKVKVPHRPFKAGDIAGTAMKNGYREIAINQVRYYAHRLAWFFVHGVWPKKLDHKNRDRADNRIENLREATISQNQANAMARKANGLKGAYFTNDGRQRPWMARTMKNGKFHYFGRFHTEQQAHEAYVEGVARVHGEYARAR
jgi:HNH endonuclease